MIKQLRVPIRFKILVSLLFLVTATVSIITFSMANLFHEDKKAYVRDLVSMVSINTAAEYRTLLVGYRERLQAYSRVMTDESLDREKKSRLLQAFFDDFPDLVAVTLWREDTELSAAFNTSALEAVGLTKSAIRDEMRRIGSRHPEMVEPVLVNATISPDLPSLVLAFPLPGALADPGGPPAAVTERTFISALLRQEPLQLVALRARGFEVSLTDSEGVLIAHPRMENVVSRQPSEMSGQLDQPGSGISAGLTLEYIDKGLEMIGGFAEVGLGGAVLRAQIPRSAAYLASRGLLDRLRFIAPALLAAAAMAGLFWSRRLTRPMEQLSEATREIAKGQFHVKVHVGSSDEIGGLAQSFNQMTSELNARESALEEAQGQLVQSEKMAAFGQLGAGIAHEVKNPLAGILGCAQLSLRRAEKDSMIHKNLVLIEKETRRCKTIIENLMRFARQERAVLEPTHLNRVVEDAAAIVNHQLEMNQVELIRALDDNLPVVMGNANQLQQVLMNLIINAQQAMEGTPGTIRVATRLAGDGSVEIEVQDSGPGMSPEVREKLFEPFFTTKPGGKGTGLGLSVSFGIVKDHGGEIRVESEVGQGARFIIGLPVPRDVSPSPERELASTC